MSALKIELASSVTIDTAEAVAEEIKKSATAADCSNLQIDCSKVEMITTPGAQILIATHKTLEKKGGKLIIENPSEAFIKAFDSLGLSETLMSWSD